MEMKQSSQNTRESVLLANTNRSDLSRPPVYAATRPPGLTYQMGGCGIAGCMDLEGGMIAGDKITAMLTTMTERENGLGAGYACYGLFPQHRQEYCLQFLFDTEDAKCRVEDLLNETGKVAKDEKVFTRRVSTMRPPSPIVWRYFYTPRSDLEWRGRTQLSDDDFVVQLVMHVNGDIEGAFCVSSGKDMAVFKGNGFSYEIAEFYDLARYRGAMWISHSRFPTNSPAWWAGAHPLSLLDWGVCHNGEITSYGVNRKLVEMNGYRCSVLTDTEVVTYLWDLLVRKHSLPIPAAAFAMAPWYHNDILRLDPESARLATWLRVTYKEALLNGPFSIIVGRREPEITMIALADRKKLRPLLVGRSPGGRTLYTASEECAVRVIEPQAETWTPNAGSPMIAQVGRGLIRSGTEHPFQVAKP
jgi:glutamate synthase domain-containing protein 1